jgi:hypothetical protein
VNTTRRTVPSESGRAAPAAHPVQVQGPIQASRSRRRSRSCDALLSRRFAGTTVNVRVGRLRRAAEWRELEARNRTTKKQPIGRSYRVVTRSHLFAAGTVDLTVRGGIARRAVRAAGNSLSSVAPHRAAVARGNHAGRQNGRRPIIIALLLPLAIHWHKSQQPEVIALNNRMIREDHIA